MLAKRQAIQKEIGELSSKRAEFISKETKKNPNPADKAFDEAIKSALREQGAARGLKLPE
jgi:hypothetical protein